MTIYGRTGLLIGLTAAAVGFSPLAYADVSVNTPPLRNGNPSASAAHVCRVTSMNAASPLMPVSVTIDIVNAFSGSVECTTTFSFTSIGATELACGGIGTIRYCQVSVASNNIADNLVVDLFLEDSNGNALGAVRGMRTPTLVPSNIASAGMITPGLTAASGQVLECSFVNTGTSNIQATGTIVSDTFGTLATTGTVTLPPLSVATVTATATPPAGGACLVTSNTAGNAKLLRASLAVTPSGGGDSTSPVGNF